MNFLIFVISSITGILILSHFDNAESKSSAVVKKEDHKEDKENGGNPLAEKSVVTVVSTGVCYSFRKFFYCFIIPNR